MGEGCGLNVVFRRRSMRESDRVVRALRLGNAGGAKDPDFWHACEEGEVEVIGIAPINTASDPDPLVQALPHGEGETCHGVVATHRDYVAGRRVPVVKSVGEPDAGNPQVRFDERGGATG